MRKRKQTQMWVSPEFHKKVSIKAAELEMTKLEVTKVLSTKEFDISPKDKRKKRSIWDWEVHLEPPKK